MSINSLIEGVIGREGAYSTSPFGRQPFVVLSGSGCVILQDHPLAVMFDENVVRPVARLFGGGGPATIARLVMAVNIDAIDGGSLRSRSHVAKECSEIVRPFGAHANAASAVVLILRIIRIVAATLGMVPRAQFRAGAAVSRVPVGDGSFSRHSLAMASAADLSTRLNMVEANSGFRTAIAAKQPFRFAATKAAHGHEVSEPLASDVEGLNHVD